MICDICGGKMEYQYTHPRGRHMKAIYLCKRCKVVKSVNVKVIGNPKMWRFLNATAALLGWGTASYIILRKQK